MSKESWSAKKCYRMHAEHKTNIGLGTWWITDLHSFIYNKMKYTVLILAVHLVRIFYKERRQPKFLWDAKWKWMKVGFLSKSWMFAQGVLKVALHHYDEVLDILKQKCSFFFFPPSSMLVETVVSRRDNQTCLECTTHWPGTKLSCRQCVQWISARWFSLNGYMRWSVKYLVQIPATTASSSHSPTGCWPIVPTLNEEKNNHDHHIFFYSTLKNISVLSWFSLFMCIFFKVSKENT